MPPMLLIGSSCKEGPVWSQAFCQADTFGLTFLCDVMLDCGEDSCCIMDEVPNHNY